MANTNWQNGLDFGQSAVAIPYRPGMTVEQAKASAKKAGTRKAKVNLAAPKAAPVIEPAVIGVDGYTYEAKPVKQQQEKENPARKSENVETAIEVGKQTQYMQDRDKDFSNARKALAAGEFIIDVINVNSAYQNATGQAQLNIQMARNSANDAIYRGRQAAFARQSEGYQAGQDATLAMAAQGQDVRGDATGKLRGSYEAMGYMNSAQEEINSMREAMGYELEEINYEYQGEMAGINRDIGYWGAGLKLGATLATGGVA